MLSRADALSVVQRCRKDPGFFVSEVLGAMVWPFQATIIDAVRDHNHVAVQACHSSGKDWMTARLALWFNVVFKPSKVICTAPTGRQVRLVLWQEMTEAYRSAKYPLGGRFLTQEWKLGPNWFAVGFATDENKPDAFAGFHSPNIFLIYDEANGIDLPLRQAGSGLLASGEQTKLLEIGNPLDANSEFARACGLRHVHTIKISAFDTPNFVGLKREDFESDVWRGKVVDPLPAPYLITPQWVDEQLEIVGRNWSDPFITSRVLGEFPDEAEDAVFKLAKLREAAERVIPPRANELRTLGCDVARYGDDATSVYLGIGPRYRKVHGHRGKKVTETADALVWLADRYDVNEIRVDDDGVGGGVVDVLTERFEGKNNPPTIYRMLNGSEPADKDRFFNARAEWYWNLYEALERGEIVLPDDPDLFAQLRAVRIKRWFKGRMVLLDTAEIKKTIGRSPDDASALIYAFGRPSAHAPLELLGSM